MYQKGQHPARGLWRHSDCADCGGRGGLKGGGGGGGWLGHPTVPPRRRAETLLSLHPLGTEGVKETFWLSASNIGRGGGGAGGDPPPRTVYGRSNTSLGRGMVGVRPYTSLRRMPPLRITPADRRTSGLARIQTVDEPLGGVPQLGALRRVDLRQLHGEDLVHQLHQPDQHRGPGAVVHVLLLLPTVAELHDVVHEVGGREDLLDKGLAERRDMWRLLQPPN